MKKFAHFRLEPIRLRCNETPIVNRLKQDYISHMFCFQKTDSKQIKQENHHLNCKGLFKINSNIFFQNLKPFTNELKYNNKKPHRHIFNRNQRDCINSQNRSRNQEDSTDDKAISFTAKTHSLSDTNNFKFNNYPFHHQKDKMFLESIVQNEPKQVIVTPLSYRKPILVEGIKEESDYCSLKMSKNKQINIVPNKALQDIKLRFIDDKEREKEKNTSLTNYVNTLEHKVRIPVLKVFKFDKYKDKDKDKDNNDFGKDIKLKEKDKDKDKEKKIKIALNKRDNIPKFNTYPQLPSNHNHSIIPLKTPLLTHIKSLSLSKLTEQIFFYTINKSYTAQFENYFSHRSNWVLVNKQAKQINFQWKYFCKNVDFRKCIYEQGRPLSKSMMVNLFDNNSEIGNKKNFFLNLSKYCNKIKVNVFELIPFTIILSNGKAFDNTMEALDEMNQFLNNYIANIHPNPNLNPDIKSNNNGVYFNKFYKDHFYNENFFSEEDNTVMYIAEPFLSKKNYWIMKPVDLYKGMGIQLSNSIAEIKKLSKKILIGVDTTFKLQKTNNDFNNNENILTKEDNNNNNTDCSSNKKGKTSHIYCSSQILIQKYLDHPLLYNKRKFDIRCYVLVDHNFNVYYCREGHLKGCSVEYDIESTCPFRHITNHSFQKHSENFQKYEDGNEMSYQNFKDFLTMEKIPLEYFEAMIKKMKYAIEISMNSVGAKLNKKDKMLSFEIFGYDFIIDKNFMPWILEINNNPGLGISSPVIEKLVPRMLDDAFRLTIDSFYETRYDQSVIEKETMRYKSKFPLDGYSDYDNLFEFLCNIDKLPI